VAGEDRDHQLNSEPRRLHPSSLRACIGKWGV